MNRSALESFATLLASLVIAAGSPLAIAAQQPPLVRSPVSPEESLQHFVVERGLKVELVAHEPNVIDPVAIRFDEDGRMWVVEMRDYPTGSPDGTRGSRMSVLDDKDGDGFFETATVLAENLRFATGLQPWKGGVFVTMAGEVAYMKDTNGDGRADVRETWFKGFSEQNTQLRANHPRLSLDNHIYIANGLRGGTIIDAQRPDAKPISISGMDFRFNPLTRECEAVSGVGQFGLTFDDYGNRFVCSNRNPAIHIVLEDHHLKKNPLVAASAVSHDVAKAGDESRVFPVTRAWTTSHLHAGQFTAACGIDIYRGDALPAQFYGNIFVCEPTGHLVHHEIMEPHGVTFTSRPAPPRSPPQLGEGEGRGVEFLASRDEWFSPVNLEVGPDGALYVVDMYRAVIEHPEWMPTELRERPDLLHGNDRGRIYRIVAKNFRRPPAPELSSKSSEQLVDYLEHPNAWWRETAARLLLERQDKKVFSKLDGVVVPHKSPIAQIHALRLLQGLTLLNDEQLQVTLESGSAQVVEQAIILADSFVEQNPQLGETISNLRWHKDPRVRFQALLTARAPPQASKFPADRWELEAMLIATGDRGGDVLAGMLRDTKRLEANVGDPKRFIADLARLAAASENDRQQTAAIEALIASATYGQVGLAALLGESSNNGRTIEHLRRTLSSNVRRKLDDIFNAARLASENQSLAEPVRGEAIDLLAVVPSAVEPLTALALHDSPQTIRVRAIAALAKQRDLDPWRKLLERFSSESPALQNSILAGVLSNNHRTMLLLDEIMAGRIRATELDTSRTAFLLNHRDAEIKRTAEEIFAEAIPSDREQALADYRSAISMRADPARGRAVFEKHCGTCHRVAGVGINFAPDISDSREKTPEQLLTDIIQPNRAIDSNYFSYTAVTTDGVVHTGILAAETSTSVTLKQAEGKSVTLRRTEIDELFSNGVSLMPDGIEKLISPQQMADLISFVKNWRYLNADGIPAVR